MIETKGALLADDMGLGKTLQAIGVINCMPELKRILIVCPASVKLQWRKELLTWLTRPYQSAPVFGDAWPEHADIVIINPHILARHKHRISSIQWDMVIADESHQYLRAKSQRAKVIRSVKVPYKICMTGTPILNKIEDIYYTLNFLDKQTWNNVLAFRRKYTDGYGKSSDMQRSALQQVLRSTVMIRRLKPDVFKDMPKKSRQVIEVDDTVGMSSREGDISDRQLEITQRLQSALILAKVSDDPKDYVKALSDLREHHSYSFAETARLRRETAVAKIPITISHIKDCLESVSKLTVWCHHSECVESIAREFPNSVTFYGETSPKARLEALNKFLNDDDCHLFVCSIRAAGTGLDGLQNVCSHAIYHEIDWVPAIMDQTESRLDRIGQSSNCLFQYIVVAESMDAAMAKINVEKLEMASQCLNVDRDGILNEPIGITRQGKPAVNITSREMQEVVIDPSQSASIHECMKFLHDHLKEFVSDVDASVAKSLSIYHSLSNRQSILGQKLVRRYSHQLPVSLVKSAT